MSFNRKDCNKFRKEQSLLCPSLHLMISEMNRSVTNWSSLNYQSPQIKQVTKWVFQQAFHFQWRVLQTVDTFWGTETCKMQPVSSHRPFSQTFFFSWIQAPKMKTIHDIKVPSRRFVAGFIMIPKQQHLPSNVENSLRVAGQLITKWFMEFVVKYFLSHVSSLCEGYGFGGIIAIFLIVYIHFSLV